MDTVSSPGSAARRRPRRLLGAAGLVIAAIGLGPVVVAHRGSAIAGATPVLAASIATGGTSDSTVRSTTTVANTTVASTTASAADSPTAAPAATTTTSAPSTTPTTLPAAVARTAASVAPTQLEHVEAIADASGFGWRAAGVTVHIGYNPDSCCHWGIYDYRDNSLWIGPTAFASEVRLRYVVLHELGHAWQWATGQRGQLAADMAPWGSSGNDALEYGADCVATIWGAQTDHYWACPAAAQALVSRRLAGDWS